MSPRSKQAMAAYRRGALEEALSIQRRVVAAQNPQAEDFLLLAMLLHSSKQTAEAFAALREGLRRYPDSAELHENLGVCLIRAKDSPAAVQAFERALALGSQGTNVLDGLCSALGHVGRHAEAVAYGRKSLEQKDAKFAALPALARIPATPPLAFDGGNRSQNIISYALWGAEPRYIVPLLENLRIREHLFPGWTIRVYLDDSVPPDARSALEQSGAQIVASKLVAGVPPARKLLWRFAVIAEPSIKRFLVRDADSLLSVKERVAVDDWIRSGKYFHAMRDGHTHTDLILAGLWGGVGGILPPPESLWEQFKPWRLENDHIDQDLLSVTVWPTIRQSCLIHDSVFTGCLGSVPFPPYGELPKGHHVGQNAFIHFKEGK